jgi:hypothetical protein
MTTNNHSTWQIGPRNFIWVMMVFVLAISVYENFLSQGCKAWKEVIASDGRGYYAYLPSVFVYSEIGFEKVIEREKEVYPSVQAASFITEADGKPVNKYFMGVALLMMPFFLLGTLLSLLFGISADGFNGIYQFMASISALFYLFVGLNFIRRLLILFKFKRFIVSLVLMLILFGTNLLSYTVAASAMSHVYSFAAIAGFMYFAASYFRQPHKHNAFLTVMFLALIVLIRPINGIVVFLLPVLAPDFGRFSETIRGFFRSRWSYLFMFAATLFVMMQPVWWYLETGNWLVWSYSGEGFYFSNPQIFNVLFSFRKGFFVYTPICFVAIIGLVPLYRSNKLKGIFTIIFLFIYVWLVSSWWNWYYGDSFGQRVFIDIFPVFAILLAFMFRWIANIRWLCSALITITFILLALNLFQTWQYSRGILHPYAMDREKYAMVFLRTGGQYRYIFNELVDIPPYNTNMDVPIRSWINDFEQEEEQWITSGRTTSTVAHGGSYVSRLNRSQPYSSALLITGGALPVMKKNLYAAGSVWVFETMALSSQKAKLVISLAGNSEQLYYWKSMGIDEMPVTEAGYWREIRFGFVLPAIRNINDQLKIFIWYEGEPDILVDDFEIGVFGPK